MPETRSKRAKRTEQPSSEPGQSIPTGVAPRLPDDVLNLVAAHLANVRQHRTLAALCATSKKHYELLRRHLYRRFYFNRQSSRFLHQVILQLYARERHLLPQDALSLYLINPARRVMTTYSPVYERTSLIEELYVESLADDDVLRALRIFRPALARKTPFPNLRLVVLAGSSWHFRKHGDENTDYGSLMGMVAGHPPQGEENAELAELLGVMMHPTRICVELPIAAENDCGPITVGFDRFVQDPDGIIFSETLYCLLSSRSESAPRVQSICVHDPRRCVPPVIVGKDLPPIDVYFPAVDLESTGEGRLLELVESRKLRLNCMAHLWQKSEPRSSYRLHGFLDDEVIAMLKDQGGFENVEDGITRTEQQLVKKLWMEGIHDFMTRLYPEHYPRFEGSPPRWPEYEKLLEEHFEFFPPPPADARCPHCHINLRTVRCVR